MLTILLTLKKLISVVPNQVIHLRKKLSDKLEQIVLR